MRFTAGFLTGLFFRPVLRLLLLAAGLAVVYGLVRGGLDQIAAADTDQARIVRAVDGDTLVVRTNGAQERVRVLGIDTPETVKPGTAVQRCGPEASARAKAWAKAHPRVTLSRDAAAPDTDRYGRLLRYVAPAGGGRDLSEVQVAAGLARVAAYGQDLRELPSLRAAARRAREAHRGLYGTSCAVR